MLNIGQSKREILKQIKKYGGITRQQALELDARDDLWFGIGYRVLDVIEDWTEAGILSHDPESDKWTLAEED